MAIFKEPKMSKKLKILIAWSGGKDSHASMIWSVNNPDWKGVKKEAVFCDTGWEHDLTYDKVKEVPEKLNIPLKILKSKKYDGFVDLAKKKGRMPSSQARFCTEELKTKPMIDYILDECQNYNLIIVQGIRADESNSRSKMNQSCTYFKYYREPYGHDKNGKPKYHTYRKKEVLSFIKSNLDDVYRPIFYWSGAETLNYILENNHKPNELYYKGAGRVGCFPCIMTNKKELWNIIEFDPSVVQKLIKAEEEAKSTFFIPDKVPSRYHSKTIHVELTEDRINNYTQEELDYLKSKGKVKVVDNKEVIEMSIAMTQDVVKYLQDTNATGLLFNEDEGEDRKCMSYYSICE